MKKIIFLDRDGCIIQEAKDQMLNEIKKIRFLPKAITSLSKIANQLDYEFVMVTNQDGLGGPTFPEKQFWECHDLILETLANEGVHFDSVQIDRHFPEDHSPNRKPGTGMLKKYTSGDYDLENSFVIGDRWSDMELAKNLGCKGILISSAFSEAPEHAAAIEPSVVLKTSKWQSIYDFLIKQERKNKAIRNTNETKIECALNLDGTGLYDISTGLKFLDHMLEQLARHGKVDLFIKADGDLHIDEHHTIEDVGIALGQLYKEALGKKTGIERYGFSLPMDDVKVDVAIDFGGRPWLVWDAKFEREKIGDLPSEMIYHFFKSFSDNALCNLYVKAEGENEHHKVEAIFKGVAKAIKMAKKRNLEHMVLPTTKGVL